MQVRKNMVFNLASTNCYSPLFGRAELPNWKQCQYWNCLIPWDVFILVFFFFLFAPSCGNLRLHKRQGGWTLLSGRCHHLCHKEKWWWVVWGCNEWSNRTLSRELCGVHHALLWMKTTMARSRTAPHWPVGFVGVPQISTSSWGTRASELNEGRILVTNHSPSLFLSVFASSPSIL